MAGIYIHVPFCKTRCHYCDFYKSTKLQFKDQYLQKVVDELRARRDFFEEKGFVETIYFGGGTPSLISSEWIYEILNVIKFNFRTSENLEITIEVNPDDISIEYYKEILKIGVNRLSIGVQSFLDNDLQQMGRRHNAEQSYQALDVAFDSGFDNVGIDLIYGLPWAGEKHLLQNLSVVNQYPVKHLSAYHLTIEPGTKFGKDKLERKLWEVDESESEKMFWMLHEETQKMGFDHYEISNFSKDGLFSRHNTSYWTGRSYLGVGPGAHSFDGTRRYWNKADLHKYITFGYFPGVSYETLTEKDRFNELLMLDLRTKSGINIDLMKDQFSELWSVLQPGIEKWITQGFLYKEGAMVSGTRKGWFVIDGIIENLFVL
jgi:oxygen-independent coproporphyrinogen-3 oxidase